MLHLLDSKPNENLRRCFKTFFTRTLFSTEQQIKKEMKRGTLYHKGSSSLLFGICYVSPNHCLSKMSKILQRRRSNIKSLFLHVYDERNLYGNNPKIRLYQMISKGLRVETVRMNFPCAWNVSKLELKMISRFSHLKNLHIYHNDDNINKLFILKNPLKWTICLHRK